MNENAIELKDVRFTYRKGDFLLKLPSFSVRASETLAILGRSGTGKTTLLNILAGNCMPDHGSVCVMGSEVSGMPESERRSFRIRNVGMVFQEFELLDHLNVLDNILLPYRITPALQCTAAVAERAAGLATEVGLREKLTRNVRQLSQGERQRVAVCRALLPEPSVLLCDEPTGNLDPENSAHVMDVIFRYAGEHQATVLAVTHDHGMAARFDRTVDLAEIAGGDA